LSRCHNQKLYLETNLPHLFKNNPHIETIYDVNIGEFIPEHVVIYDFNGHHHNGIQKQIRKMSMFDYFSSSHGFQLLPEERDYLKGSLLFLIHLLLGRQELGQKKNGKNLLT
jgi:hypothetical protein